jgi:hypothetical protein
MMNVALEKPEAAAPEKLKGEWWILALLALDAWLFYKFCSRYIPDGLISHLSQGAAIFIGIVGVLGLKDPEKPILRKLRRIVKPGLGATVIFVALIALHWIGWRNPCIVSVVPGSTILVDDKPLQESPERREGMDSSKLETLVLYLPWGPHKVSVIRRGHMNMVGHTPELEEPIELPFGNSKVSCRHAAFLHVKTALESDSRRQPGNLSEHERRVAKVRDTLVLAIQHGLESEGESITPCSLAWRPTEGASFTLEIAIEPRPYDQDTCILLVRCLDRDGVFSERFYVVPIDPDQLPPVAEEFHADLLGVLGIKDSKQVTKWRHAVPALLDECGSIVETIQWADVATADIDRFQKLPAAEAGRAVPKIAGCLASAFEALKNQVGKCGKDDQHLRTMTTVAGERLLAQAERFAPHEPPESLKALSIQIRDVGARALKAGLPKLVELANSCLDRITANIFSPEQSIVKKDLIIQNSALAREVQALPKPVPLRLKQSTYHLPDEGKDNQGSMIGDFCCTGKTVTVFSDQDQVLGYLYWYDFAGGVILSKTSSAAESVGLLVSGITGAPGSERIKGKITFTPADIAREKAVTVGKLRYRATLEKTARVDTTAGKKFVMDDNLRFTVHVDLLP